MKVLVMGGTRLMGDAVVRRLLAEGHEVSVFHRGSRTPDWSGSVTTVLGDRDVSAQLSSVTSLDVDAVVDFSAYRGDQTASLMAVLPRKVRVIHCSTGAVYEPCAQFPWREDGPRGPWALWGAYGRSKLDAENVLLEEAAAGRAVTVFRLPFVLGPRNYAPREEFVLNRVADHAPVAVPGDGKALQQFITADQVAESVARMVDTPAPPGYQDYNVADPLAMCTLEGFVSICASVVGSDAEVIHVGGGPTGAPGPFDAGNCVFPFPNEVYLLDVTKAARAGLLPEPRPLVEAIQRAWNVMLAEPERRQWVRTAAETAALAQS